MDKLLIVFDVFAICFASFTLIIKLLEKPKKDGKDAAYMFFCISVLLQFLTNEIICSKQYLILSDSLLSILLMVECVLSAFTLILLGLYIYIYGALRLKKFLIIYIFEASLVIILSIANCFYPIIYEAKAGEVFKLAGYIYYDILLALIILTNLIFLIVHEIKNKKIDILVSSIVFYLVAIVFEFIGFKIVEIYIFSFASLFTLLMLFINELMARNRLLNQKEIELVNANVTLMLSQIRPHFLYNTLSAIGYLCETDPQKASEALDNFSFYLRKNLESIGSNNVITFSEELEHIKYYVSLEKLRLGDKLNIVYDINENDFFIPTLSIQPLVENAIKHGIAKNDKPGTVEIKTYSKDKEIFIEVNDDGIGFDTNNIDPTRVGLQNIKKRLSVIGNYEITLNSEIGKGTKVLIKLRRK